MFLHTIDNEETTDPVRLLADDPQAYSRARTCLQRQVEVLEEVQAQKRL